MINLINIPSSFDDMMNDPVIADYFNKYFFDHFPEVKKKSFIQKTSYTTGKATGKIKNFFSKTETKSATLLAYWGADTLVALFLILTSPSMLAVSLACMLLILHTYATFSVITQIIK